MTYDSDHTSGPWDRRAHPDLGASPVPAGGDTTAPPRRDVVCATCDGLIWRLTIPVSGTVTTVRQTIFGPTAFRWRRHGVLPVREENRQPCPACGQDPNDKGRS